MRRLDHLLSSWRLCAGVKKEEDTGVMKFEKNNTTHNVLGRHGGYNALPS